MDKCIVNEFDLNYRQIIKDKNVNINDEKLDEIMNIIIKEVVNIYEKEGMDERKILVQTQKIKRTKKRWVKNAVISKDKAECSIEGTKKILEWYENDDLLLLDYPFFYLKSKYSINTSIKADGLLRLMKLMDTHEINRVLEDMEKDTMPKKAVSCLPKLFTSLPFNVNKKSKPQSLEQFRKQYNNVRLTLEYEDEDFKKAINMRSGANFDKAIQCLNSSINHLDRAVLKYLFTVPGIVEGTRVKVRITDIVNNTLASDNHNNFLSVKISLYKLYTMQVEMFSKNKYTDLKFLSTLELDSDNNSDYAAVTMHAHILDELFNRYTVNLFSDEIKNFNEEEEIIMYFLQRKRIKYHLTGEPMVQVWEYWRFTEALASTSRKDRYIAKIIKILHKIEKSNSVISDFRRNGDFFTLTFKEMSDTEIRELDYDKYLFESEPFKEKMIEEVDYVIK